CCEYHQKRKKTGLDVSEHGMHAYPSDSYSGAGVTA
ncbi:hypothetical protein RMSM_05287, partial [Rhodopirellula maiorica SM1]